jgi:cysteine desulfurase
MISLVAEIAVSSGSACTTAGVEPSHVLAALGVRNEQIHSSIMFGIGRMNTIEEIEYAAERFIQEVIRLRDLVPRS